MDEYDDFDQCYDEGSDIDNWEAEQCFQDQQAEMRADADFEDDEDDEEGDYLYDEEAEMERRAEYAMESALGFGE